jgi:hypothetical protein
MTGKLEIFKAELEALEAADAYDAPQYDYLVEMVERLQAEEQAAKPQAAQAPAAAEPAGDSIQAIHAEMEAALARQAAGQDVDVDGLLGRLNTAIMAGATQPESTDLGQLQRDMLQAGADPGALSEEQRADLLRRFNSTRLPRRTSEELRADLGSNDLPARMRAAEALQRRGELSDEQATELVNQYNAAVGEALERGPNLDELPPELRDAAAAIYKAKADLEVPADPVAAALYQLDQAIRSMRPPTLAEQFEALGVEPPPEPEPVPVGATTSEE